MQPTNTSKTIRVGLIGLSSGGGWASIAHVPYLRQTDRFTVTGICNSSIDSGKSAINKNGFHYAVPYASVQDMCDSNTVDLVVCAVAVFSHYNLIKPAILSGKDVDFEWPLGASTAEAEELASLARENGVRTIIGLQARVSHIVTTLEMILNSGRIGKPLATHIIGSACTGETGTKLAKRFDYFKDRDVEGADGQVMLTIYIGHTIEPLAQLLGEPTKISTELQTTWPKVDIIDGDKVIASGVEKTASDYASLQGEISSGVKYTYCLRGGDAFDEQGLVWDIVGDKGEIRLTGSTIMMNLGAEDYKIRVKDYETGRVEHVQMDEHLDLPLAGQNIGRLYENYAERKPHPIFEDAVQRHKFLSAAFGQ